MHEHKQNQCKRKVKLFTKKKIGNLVPNADVAKVQAVAGLVADLLEANTGSFYVTELSQIQE